MKITSQSGPFVAEITGRLLAVRRCDITDTGFDNGSMFTKTAVTALFTCSLRKMPWFVMHSDGLYAQNDHDALTPMYRGEDAQQLLCCLTVALARAEKRRSLRLRLTAGVAGIAIALAVWLAGSYQETLVNTPARVALQALSSSVVSPLSATSTQRAAADIVAKPAMAPASQIAPLNVPENPPVAAPADGWSLPLAVRTGLPNKLQKAASRGIFTVPLSSGHPRTLYVFADPECPNCLRMERQFEAASALVNVVVFPVTIVGGADSLKSLAPVMALPESARPAAWKHLFSADAGMDVPGRTPDAGATVTDEAALETARGALGVNEVAFRAYRLPGTPWTISDDGRYVPQAALSSPAALQAFLNEGGPHDGQ